MIQYYKDTPSFIRCAKCRKPVDEVVQVVNAFQTVRKFIVRCHGETEECEVNEELLSLWRIEEITAFQDKPGLPEIEDKGGI